MFLLCLSVHNGGGGWSGVRSGGVGGIFIFFGTGSEP